VILFGISFWGWKLVRFEEKKTESLFLNVGGNLMLVQAVFKGAAGL
jgi:hypothetical protein